MRRLVLGLVCLLLLWGGLVRAEVSGLPAAPLRSAFGSRCAKSPIPCNRIDYFTAHVHIADVILLPATDSRGFAATTSYGASMSLFHRVEVGIGGTLSVWTPQHSGITIQNGPALLNVKGVLFPLLRNPVPDTEFTFALQLQQQLRIPRFDGPNDLGTETPLTALRAVADKPFWRMGITASLGFLLTPGRTDSELSAALRIHLPWMSRATVQGFGVLQGLFGSKQSAPLRGGLGLSVHFAWDNGTSISGGYMHGRGDGAAPSAIYLGGPDYHIGRETESHSYSRPPIPNRESVPSPWPWLWDTLQREWNEAQLANEAHRRGEDWLTDECFLYEEGKYDKPLRHLGKRDASGKFCNVNGTKVPLDEPLREEAGNLIPLRTPVPSQDPDSQRRSPTPPPPPHTAHPSEAPKSQPEDPRQVPSPKRGGLGRGLAPKGDGGPKENPELSLRKEVPKEETQVSSLNHAPIPPDAAIPIAGAPSLGESARQFARGFGKGVRDETTQMYRDVTELPHRVATTGRELLEDIQAGRKLRALAPIEALAHAIRNASREDVKKIAHAVVDGAIDFYNKSPQEKGESLGKATVSIATDAAIAALTDGLGSVAGLRKAEKALEAADHAKDAERAAAAVSHRPALQHSGRGRNHLQPDAAAEGSHTTLRRNQDGGVSHHIEWTPNARNPSGFDEVKRVDTQHANPHSHRNKATGEEVMTPHTHEPTTPGGIRPARPDELPR